MIHKYVLSILCIPAEYVGNTPDFVFRFSLFFFLSVNLVYFATRSPDKSDTRDMSATRALLATQAARVKNFDFDNDTSE